MVGTARADDEPLGESSGVEKGSFGVGLIIGEPTGLTARLYLGDDVAVQAAVGSDFGVGALQVHVDYVWHPWLIEDRDSFVLLAYVGPGVRFIYYDKGRDGDDYPGIGLRVVGGLVFDF